MANSWKFMLKKNQLTCFIFDMNFHEYSMNFHKLLYKPFLFFYLIFISYKNRKCTSQICEVHFIFLILQELRKKEHRRDRHNIYSKTGICKETEGTGETLHRA